MDLLLTEGGNGGDVFLAGNDLKVIYGWENMIYIALFGHRGGVTKSTYTNNEFRSDFWMNSLLHPQEPAAQINSLCEDVLHSTPLTSAGRLLIEEAIKSDLRFMQNFAEITVVTEIISTDNLKISIKVVQPDNLQQKDYIFIWDSVRQEILDPDIFYIPNQNQPVYPPSLQYELQFSL